MHEPRNGPPPPDPPRGATRPYAHLATPPDMIRWDLGERPVVDEPKGRVCIFRIAQYELAVPGKHSQGFRELDSSTPIPLAPPHILGLAHVSGHILPVVDLAQFPDPEMPAVKRTTKETLGTLVLHVDNDRLCLVVDEVLAFEPFDTETLLPLGQDPLPWRSMLAGMAHVHDRQPVPVLDLAAAVAALRLAPEAHPDAPTAGGSR